MPSEKGKEQIETAIEESKKASRWQILRDILKKQIGKKENRAKIAAETSKEILEPESESPKAGKLNEKYDEYSKEINEEKKEKDLNQFKNTDYKTIRSNPRLLNKEAENEKPEDTIKNLKDETARRLDIYTKKLANGWRRLDYESVGGYDHEWNIGLGDIFIDPDIKKVAVKKPDGQILIGERIADNPKKRPGFYYQTKSGNLKYLATFSGDEVLILTDKETDIKNEDKTKNYLETYKKEKKAREEYLISYEKNRTIDSNIDINITSKELQKAKPISEEQIIKKLNNHREKNDGQEILEYLKKACADFDIPFAVYKELIQVESGWNPGIVYSGQVITSDATGLGQFLGKTWNGFIEYCNKNDIHHNEWGDKPLTQAHRTNPYVNGYATAWLMSKTKEEFNLDGKPLYEQAMIYYLAHHEGRGGAKTYLDFIGAMQETGCETKGEIINEYNANRDKYNRILNPKQVSRINKYGFNRFINVYFKFARNVAVRSSTNDSKSIEEIEKQEAKKDYYVENFEFKNNLKGVVDLKKDQNAIFGSSIAIGQKGYGNYGIFGIEGANASNFLPYLKERWHKIEPLHIPQITIVGFAVNGLNEDEGKSEQEIEKNARERINKHMEIVNFLKERGIKTKIAGNHLYKNKKEHIRTFNRILEEEHPEYFIDISSKVETSDLHLDKSNKTRMGKILEEV